VSAENLSGRREQSSPFNRSAQHQAKRAAILSEAARLFNHKGSRATTLRDIAETLGLTTTSLYYYVSTKEELIYQCYLATLQHHGRVLDDIERAHSEPLQRFSAFIMHHFENWQAARAGRAPHIAALLEIAALKAPHRQEVESQYIAIFKRLRKFVRQGIAEGNIRPVEPTSTILAVLGSLDWTFSWLRTIPTENIGAAADAALDLFTHGLFTGPGSYQPAELVQPPLTDKAMPGFNRGEQNRLKKEAFFKTGTWYFNKKGFSGTSLDEIAEHLSVSKGAFYYHIRNKEDLLLSCYKRSLDVTEEINRQAGSMDAPGLQKAEMACRGMFYVQNSREGPLIRYNSITALPVSYRRGVLARTEHVNQRFGQFLAGGMEDGSVRPVDAFVAQQLIAGAINAAMDIDLWRKIDDLDSAAIDYFDVFFNGLLPREQAR